MTPDFYLSILTIKPYVLESKFPDPKNKVSKSDVTYTPSIRMFDTSFPLTIPLEYSSMTILNIPLASTYRLPICSDFIFILDGVV